MIINQPIPTLDQEHIHNALGHIHFLDSSQSSPYLNLVTLLASPSAFFTQFSWPSPKEHATTTPIFPHLATIALNIFCIVLIIGHLITLLYCICYVLQSFWIILWFQDAPDTISSDCCVEFCISDFDNLIDPHWQPHGSHHLYNNDSINSQQQYPNQGDWRDDPQTTCNSHFVFLQRHQTLQTTTNRLNCSTSPPSLEIISNHHESICPSSSLPTTVFPALLEDTTPKSRNDPSCNDTIMTQEDDNIQPSSFQPSNWTRRHLYRSCLRCSVPHITPPRAHHCSYHHSCHVLFDHYCIALGACISWGNRRSFYRLIILNVICCMFVFFTLFICSFDAIVQHQLKPAFSLLRVLMHGDFSQMHISIFPGDTFVMLFDRIMRDPLASKWNTKQSFTIGSTSLTALSPNLDSWFAVLYLFHCINPFGFNGLVHLINFGHWVTVDIYQTMVTMLVIFFPFLCLAAMWFSYLWFYTGFSTIEWLQHENQALLWLPHSVLRTIGLIDDCSNDHHNNSVPLSCVAPIYPLLSAKCYSHSILMNMCYFFHDWLDTEIIQQYHDTCISQRNNNNNNNNTPPPASSFLKHALQPQNTHSDHPVTPFTVLSSGSGGSSDSGDSGDSSNDSDIGGSESDNRIENLALLQNPLPVIALDSQQLATQGFFPKMMAIIHRDESFVQQIFLIANNFTSCKLQRLFTLALLLISRPLMLFQQLGLFLFWSPSSVFCTTLSHLIALCCVLYPNNVSISEIDTEHVSISDPVEAHLQNILQMFAHAHQFRGHWTHMTPSCKNALDYYRYIAISPQKNHE